LHYRAVCSAGACDRQPVAAADPQASVVEEVDASSLGVDDMEVGRWGEGQSPGLLQQASHRYGVATAVAQLAISEQGRLADLAVTGEVDPAQALSGEGEPEAAVERRVRVGQDQCQFIGRSLLEGETGRPAQGKPRRAVVDFKVDDPVELLAVDDHAMPRRGVDDQCRFPGRRRRVGGDAQVEALWWILEGDEPARPEIADRDSV
jgi:hypothetical protein